MQTFLTVVAGAIAGFGLVGLLGLVWVRRKERRAGRALAAAEVPPFRIRLMPVPAPDWADAVNGRRTFQGFTAAGYAHCGDFEIPEMNGRCLRGFFHRGLRSFGVVYDHADAGLVVELVREHGDGTTTTVTSGPDTGMERPGHAPIFRLEVDVTGLNGVGKLHERLEDESAGRGGAPWRPEDFSQLFAEGHSQLMDWRIARGGVSADELRRAASANRQPAPDGRAVRVVQKKWRAAIDAFVTEEVRSAWLQASAMHASDRERVRDAIEVVHDHAAVEDRIEALASRMVEGSSCGDDEGAEQGALIPARAELAPLFSNGVRAGFAAAQALLPETRRYERLASLEAPWPADLYRQPEALGDP